MKIEIEDIRIDWVMSQRLHNLQDSEVACICHLFKSVTVGFDRVLSEVSVRQPGVGYGVLKAVCRICGFGKAIMFFETILALRYLIGYDFRKVSEAMQSADIA